MNVTNARLPLKLILISAALGMLGGCSNATTHTYDVKVKNESPRPITLWLTKDGPPFEPKWASPEDLATERPGGSNVYLGVVVPPTKTGTAGPVSAKLDPNTRAYVRIYAGGERFSDLLSKSRGSPDRLDIVLQPGMNHYIVTEQNGRLTANRDSSSSTSP